MTGGGGAQATRPDPDRNGVKKQGGVKSNKKMQGRRPTAVDPARVKSMESDR